MTLREELVGIADDFFLQCLGQEVSWWNDGQMLRNNFVCTDARSRVPLADTAMAEEAYAIENLSANDAVQDIGLGAIAINARSIGAAHADVMQHRGFLDKLYIDRHMIIDEALRYHNSQAGNLTAMKNQHPVIIITGCVVSLND